MQLPTNHEPTSLVLARRPWDVPKERACLKCKSIFASQWSGERLCSRCKSQNGWRNAAPAAISRPRTAGRASPRTAGD